MCLAPRERSPIQGWGVEVAPRKGITVLGCFLLTSPGLPPAPAVPALLSLCPVLPPHSQLVLSCMSRRLPRICSLRGARRGQQVSLCLSQGCHHAMLSIPQQSPGAAGWVPALTPAAEAVQGSLPGWNDPGGEDGPHVYPQCSILSTLHTARASPPSVHSPGTGNVSAGSGWSRDRGGVGSWSSLWLLGSHLHPVGGEAAGYWGTGRSSNLPQCLFFPLSVKLCIWAKEEAVQSLVPPVPTALV